MKEISDDYMMFSLANIFYNKANSNMTIPNMGVIIDPNDPESLAKAMGKGEANSISRNDKNVNENDIEDKDKMNEDKDLKSNNDKDIKEDE